MKPGVDSTSDFAQQLQWLLEDKYGWSRQKSREAVADSDFQFSPEIQADITLLQSGVPLAYVIGWVSFLGRKIDLSLKPLIPRPETEAWVGECLRRNDGLARAARDYHVLDLCCGSGCIAAAVKQHWPSVEIFASDIDPNAVEQTKLNITGTDVTVLHSDLFFKITGEFDLIFSNPPYVDRDAEFEPSVLFEPDQAVFTEDRGLAVVKEIIFQVKKFLKPDGQLWLEFAFDQAKQVSELCAAAELKCSIEKDQYGKNRFAVITLPSSPLTKSASRHQN